MSAGNSKLLKKYRDEIRDVTRSILDLVVARQILASKIADAKESSNADIENHTVEESLSKEMIEYSNSLGLDKELASNIVHQLIEYSKISQRRKIFLKLIRAHLRSEKIRVVSIIGAGRMGGWFARYFNEAGAQVLLYDENRPLARSKARKLDCRWAKNLNEVAKADFVIIAVPISATPREIRRLVSKANPEHQLRVIEISSVKHELEKTGLLGKKGFPDNLKLYSVHPLFGPNANPFSVNSLIQVGNSDFVRNIFPHYKVFSMSAKNHDKLMGTLLTIPHIHALSFADSISAKTIPETIESPSFDYMLDLSKRLLKESEDVYYDIEATNPYARQAINETKKSIAKLQKLLQDRSAFRKFFRDADKRLN